MIDVKRLAVDAGYWDEVAGAIGGTHYDKETGFFCDEKGYYSEHGFKPWIRINPVRDQPERFIPRPQPQPEWVDGLPPVGAECESATRGAGFRAGHITYVSDQILVWIDKLSGHEYATGPQDREFRPIPTPEQRQREDLEQKITIALRACHAGDSDKAAAQRVVDVILSRYTLELKP